MSSSDFSCLPCRGRVSPTPSLSLPRPITGGASSEVIAIDPKPLITGKTLRLSTFIRRRRLLSSSTSGDTDSSQLPARSKLLRFARVSAGRNMTSSEALDLDQIRGSYDAYDPDAVLISFGPYEASDHNDYTNPNVDGLTDAPPSCHRNGFEHDRTKSYIHSKASTQVSERSYHEVENHERADPSPTCPKPPRLELGQLNNSGLSINWPRGSHSSSSPGDFNHPNGQAETNCQSTARNTLSLPQMRISQHLRSMSEDSSNGLCISQPPDAIASPSTVYLADVPRPSIFNALMDGAGDQTAAQRSTHAKLAVICTNAASKRNKKAVALGTAVIHSNAPLKSYLSLIDGATDDTTSSARSRNSIAASYDSAGRVWEKALNAHQNNLERTRDDQASASQRLSMAVLGRSQLAKLRHDQDSRRKSSISFKPLTSGQHADPGRMQVVASTDYRGTITSCSDIQRASEPLNQRSSSKIRPNGSTWSKFPSHTRHEQNSSAGAQDGVITRDFAEGSPATDDESEVDPMKLTKTQKYNKRRAVFRKVSNAIGDFARPFSFGNRMGERGHRSSIAAGGSLEYPDLELVAGHEHRLPHGEASFNSKQEAATKRSRAASLNVAWRPRYASNMGSSEYVESEIGHMQNSDGSADVPIWQWHSSNAHDSAQAWAQMYRDCLPDFHNFASAGAAARVMLDGTTDSDRCRTAASLPDLSSIARSQIPGDFGRCKDSKGRQHTL